MSGTPADSMEDVAMADAGDVTVTTDVVITTYDDEGFVSAKTIKVARAIDPDKKPKAVNPRMLLLDFTTGMENPFQAVKNILDNKTQIRGYSMQRLARGGISVWFRRPGQKTFAEGLIKEELASKLVKKSWTDKKTLFEVVIYGIPRSFNVKKLETITGVAKTQALPGRVVLFVKTKQRAQELCQNGVEVDDYYFTVNPFIFRPKVACNQCGSMSHSRCEVVKCLKCGGEGHLAKDCTGIAVCTRCGSTEHGAFECPLYKAKLEQATQSKKKTYAESLGVGRKYVPAQKPAAASSAAVAATSPAVASVDPSLIIQGCLDIVAKFLAQLFPKQAAVDLNPLQVQMESFVKEMSLDIAAKGAAQSLQVRAPAPTVVRILKDAPQAAASTQIQLAPSQAKRAPKAAVQARPSMDTDEVEESQPKAKKVRTHSPKSAVQTADAPVKAHCSCGKDYNAVNGGWRAHLKSCKAKGIVTCLCGDWTADSTSTRDHWAQFNGHLAECSSSEMDTGNES